MRRRLAIAALAGFTLILIVGIEASLFIPLETEVCRQNEQTHQKDCAIYNSALAVLWQSFEFLNYTSPAITALATACIAAFTITLWRATERQAGLTRETIMHNTREFVATHRPRIVIRNVHIIRDIVTSLPVGKRIGVSFEIVNIGDTAATIVGSAMSIDFLSSGFLPEMRLPRRGEYAMPGWDQFRLESGVVLAQWYGNPEAFFRVEHFGNHSPQHGIFFQGRILYEDDNRNLRSTSFCRRFERDRGYWPPTTYYDYEHTD